MTFMQKALARLLVLLDYDGTVTAHECNDLVLQNLTGDAWREPETALHRGLIGHAECFRLQVAMVDVPREQYIAQVVRRRRRWRRASVSSCAPCTQAGARTAVVSAGFREAIQEVWRRNALPPVDIFASELEGRAAALSSGPRPGAGRLPRLRARRLQGRPGPLAAPAGRRARRLRRRPF